MSDRLLVVGTDTGVGKTVFSAALCAATGAAYWKPVQSGLEEVDSTSVAALSGTHIFPETYRLSRPLSPHRAAELDGIEIDPARLTLPEHDGKLVVEAAGGLLVPLTRELLYIDLIARWGLSVVLCARTTLGTINHSLLSIEALRARGIDLLGMAFVGDANEDNERTICVMGDARRLGRLPIMAELNRPFLSETFLAHFDVRDFFDRPDDRA